MMRAVLFAALAATLVAYSFWVYRRMELRVAAGRWLALVRAVALVVLLLLLFNPRLPYAGGARAPSRWVLLDGSLSMSAAGPDGRSAWSEALGRVRELEARGWSVVRFGEDRLARGEAIPETPDLLGSRLAPALAAAAEAGAREVRVLSDARLEDQVAVRAAAEALPLEISFERFGATGANAGIADFQVPDLARPDGTPVAELEVFAEEVGDTVVVEIREEDRLVATARVAAPSPGLRAATTVELPTPASQGRVRYTARVAAPGDGFGSDDEAVSYANVGFEEGGVVLVSFRPDWEPRSLAPVLEEVTGLSTRGYLRAGPDRFLPMGRAVDRGGAVDSATVRRAAQEATILVLHGLAGGADPWVVRLVDGPGRRLVFPVDAGAAALVGLEASSPRGGEWYVSPDVPTSPVAGSLADVTLEGLPPLTDVLVPTTALPATPLQLQLRGAGPPESAFALLSRPDGRAAVALASGFWRWAMREGGREPYRRLWSGVAGWLLADRGMAAAEPRPVRWVFDRSEPVEWRMPADTTTESRILLRARDSIVVDTTLTGGGPASLGILPPARYDYTVTAAGGDTLAAGRFDVAATTLEMLPRAEEPALGSAAGAASDVDTPPGRPLRTLPWPYLLVITLLCGEWIVRRRSGLR